MKKTMSNLSVVGGFALDGEVEISGSKNAALAVLPAALLSDGTVEINCVPDISDIHTMLEIIQTLGVKAEFENGTVRMDTTGLTPCPLPNGLVSQIRASIYLAGVLAARFGEATIGLPGGCPLNRQVDFHIDAFKKMGAKVIVRDEIIKISCPKGRLQGAVIELDPRWRSFGTTVNVLLASSLAEGTTVIKNASMEPEVICCVRFLKAMGSSIKGEGTKTIVVEGLPSLRPANFSVICDRMEAGTFLLAGSATNGKVTVIGVPSEWLHPFLEKLWEAGVNIQLKGNRITASMAGRARPITVMTEPFPGFPTDLQPLIGSFLTRCDGVSLIVETIHRDRLLYMQELTKLSAKVVVETAMNLRNLPCLGWIFGTSKLHGAQVEATDLRACAGLIIAALQAEGETIINKAERVHRGYERIVEKLQSLGASIQWKDLAEKVSERVVVGSQLGN